MRQPRYYLRQVLQAEIPRYITGGTVLDIGCGRAKYRHLFERYCDQYLALDDGSSQPQFGNTESGTNLDLIADVQHLPIPSNSVDSVVCTQVIEHVPRPWMVFAEIARVVKPGGVALVSSGWLIAYHPEPLDYYRYTAYAYLALAAEYNLEPLKIIAQGGAFSGLLVLVTRMIVISYPIVQKMLTMRPWNIAYRVLELLAERLDPLWKGEDCLGHLLIARKPDP